MIEEGNFSNFNVVRTRNLDDCTDKAIVTILSQNPKSFPRINKLLTETTSFYAEHFPTLKLRIKREKRLVVFDTPSRAQMTHEYTLEGTGNLSNGFYFLFNATERLSWLKVYIEERRLSIASKDIILKKLVTALGGELNRLCVLLNKKKKDVTLRLYEAADGRPCFVEFNKKEYKWRYSLLLSITFYDSIQNKKSSYRTKWYSPLNEKHIKYNYDTLSGNATAWIYFKAPSNFVLNVTQKKVSSYVERSKSNDDEIISLVFTPRGESLSEEMYIDINVPPALKYWYLAVLYTSILVSIVCLGALSFFVNNISDSVTNVLGSISFTVIAAIIATRGWLMSEEQVMKPISNIYTFCIVVLMLLNFCLSL